MIAVTCWNYTELAPGWNFTPVFKTQVKSPLGEISPWVEHVTSYKSFFMDRGNFAPGWILPSRGKIRGWNLMWWASKITSSKIFSTTSFGVSINAKRITHLSPGMAGGLGPIFLQMSQQLTRSSFSTNVELVAGLPKFSSSISSLSCSLSVSLLVSFSALKSSGLPNSI